MHSDDFEELGGLGFGFSWAEIAELFREAHEGRPVTVGAGGSSAARSELSRTTRYPLSTEWMEFRAN